MSVVLYDGVVATPRIVDLGGRRSVPGAAITLPIACCQASPSVRMRSITHHGPRKRLWRHPNNPIAPRKFPSGWCKSTLRSPSAREHRRLTQKGVVVDLLHEEIRYIG